MKVLRCITAKILHAYCHVLGNTSVLCVMPHGDYVVYPTLMVFKILITEIFQTNLPPIFADGKSDTLQLKWQKLASETDG